MAMALGVNLVGSSIGLGYADNMDMTSKSKDLYVTVDNLTSTSNTRAVSGMVDINISESQQIRIGVSNSSKLVDFVEVGKATTSVVESNKSDLSITEIQKLAKEIEDERKMEAERARKKALAEAKNYMESTTQGGLIDIFKPDPNYVGTAIKIEGKDREILEHLVMGEAGNQGFIGAALVAQAIRDMYILGGFKSVEAVRTNCGYYANLNNVPNENVLNAVSFIFDEGGYAVKHRVLYFYAPQYSAGKFHNTQNNIVDYKGHRFFDRWN